MTAVLDDTTTVEDAAALQEAARQTYRDATQRGDKIVGRELGARFDRSDRWGRDRIAEVNAENAAKQRLNGARRRQEPPVAPEGTETPPAVLDVPTDRVATVAPMERGADPTPSGRVISLVAFAAGITVSIAANMLHAHIGDSPAGPAELIGAAFWPIALLLALEVLTRVSWPAGFWWWGFARFVGVGLVALVAAFVSYRHMAGLLTDWGEDWWNAHLGPLAVDGLMLIAAAALLAISRTRSETH